MDMTNTVNSKTENTIRPLHAMTKYKRFFKCDEFKIWEAASRRVPIVKWLPEYKLLDGISDLVAGFTVGLTLMPQAIAYAALAGLQPQVSSYRFRFSQFGKKIKEMRPLFFSTDCTPASQEASFTSFSAPSRK